MKEEEGGKEDKGEGFHNGTSVSLFKRWVLHTC